MSLKVCFVQARMKSSEKHPLNASPFTIAQKDGDGLSRGLIERPFPSLLKEMLV